MKKFTVARQAAALKVTVEQVKAPHLRNAAGCDKTAKADAAGKRINEFTADQWRTMTRNHRGIAAHAADRLYPTERV